MGKLRDWLVCGFGVLAPILMGWDVYVVLGDGVGTLPLTQCDPVFRSVQSDPTVEI